jgi:EAL domain-containing protein (putative c-di-GMP-specific phosphodiesterase class I)
MTAIDVSSRAVSLEQIVRVTQHELALDAAFASEVTEAGPVVRAVAGDPASFGIAVANEPAAEPSYCSRLLAGKIPSIVLDAPVALADIAMTQQARVGSFIGVPLRLSDGAAWGALCGLNHDPYPNFDPRDVRLMATLADLVANELDDRRRMRQLREDIESVIGRNERIKVAYQPIIDLRTNRCVGVESLARFPRRFAKPIEMFTAAGALGLSLELERLVALKACELRDELGEDQFLALNMTPEALMEMATRANATPDVPVANLVVELTEQSAVESYPALREQLAPLRTRGLGLAVDDVGAGHASLRHVVELRPDFIKIDRSLIHRVADDTARRAALGAFVMMAKDLGAQLIAEGVERAVDFEVIRELEFDAAQGYLLGRPTTKRGVLSKWIDAPNGATNGSPQPEYEDDEDDEPVLRKRRHG